MLANNAWGCVSVELSQLRYLVKIAECQSVSKAAKALNISTQGISSSIRRLENELNVTLFYRSGGKLQLTELGELIQEEARYALSRVDQITKICAGHTKGATSIPIAITKSKFIRMPIALQTLLLTPPEDYTVTMDHQLTVNCVDMVANDQALFGLVYGDYSDDPHFDTVHLEDCEQIFIVNKNHFLAQKEHLTIRDLDGLPIVAPGAGTVPGRMVEAAFRAHGAIYNVAYDCLDPRFCVDLLMKNDKIVGRMLPACLRPSDMNSITVLSIPELDFRVPFSLIVKRGRKLNAREQLFKHMILDCYR